MANVENIDVASAGNDRKARKIDDAELARALMNWRHGASGPVPFNGSTGADAAEAVIWRAETMARCLAAGFSGERVEDQSELGCMREDYIRGALDGVADLLALSQLLMRADGDAWARRSS